MRDTESPSTPEHTVLAMRRAVDRGEVEAAIELGVARLRDLDPPQRGSVLVALALAYAGQARLGEALRAASTARDLARSQGDTRLEVESVLATAAALNVAEDHTGVIQQVESVEALASALGDPVLEAQVLRRLGVTLSILGEHDRGIADLERAHALLTAAGEADQALVLRNSMLNARVRRFEQAGVEGAAAMAGHAAVLDEWLALAAQYEAADHQRMALMARGNFAICAWQCGQAERGLAELDLLLHHYAAAGMRPNVVITHNHRGHALRQLGRLDEARAAYRAVLADDAASVREQLEALEGLAAVLEDLDDARGALAALKQARALERQLGDEQARRRAERRELRLELARLNEHWSKLASEDALTGLPNRRALDAWLPAAMARATENSPLALLLIDADHFKTVNDRHGHATGDAVLKQLARLLRASCRYDDLPARMGGEELVLGLPGLSASAALDAAERLRAAIADHPWDELVPGLSVTVSIGVASSDRLPPGAMNAESLLSLADDRLYAAKRAGRNRVVD